MVVPLCKSHPSLALMEESQEILLNSLKSFGIEIPSEISSVGEINPTSLFSICTQTLRRLPLFSGEDTSSSPTFLPDSIVDRVKICTDVASAIKNRGFVGDISFHKLMYPSEEDLYKLVRFLVKRLSEASEAIRIAESHDIHAGASNLEGNNNGTVDVCSRTTAHQVQLEFLGKDDVISAGISNKEAHVISENISQKALLDPSLEAVCTRKDSCGNDDIRELTETFRGLKQNDDQQQANQWEEELAKLTLELKRQPKAASRSSYVERIKEITKNCRKQNADIERILIETREIQLESNSVEERLHRSYAVVDEMVFREAKKDKVSTQAYILLASIHRSFDEIREIILETDRAKREVADIEAKLATIDSNSFDMEKLQADINALKRENRSLDSAPL